MSKRSVDHHIVPQSLQKHFTIEGDPKRIWRSKIADGVFPEPEKKLIENCFFGRNQYTILENGKPSDQVERVYYGAVDDFLGQFIPEVLKAFKSASIPSLSPETLDSLRQVVVAMSKRTPDIRPEHDDVALGRELIEATLRAYPAGEGSEHSAKLGQDLRDERRLRALGADIRVRATIPIGPLTESVLSEFVPRWSVSYIKSSYILSSRMVYIIGNGGLNGLSNPNAEMWMPLSPKVALVLLRDRNNAIPPVVPATTGHIRSINEFAVKNSREVASHSVELLKSLLH